MRLLLASTALSLALPGLAAAQTAPPPPAADADDPQAGSDIVVTARRLDAARDAIDPSIGANTFAFDRTQLDSQPGGADLNLKGVLLQAPGVAQDSDGDGDIHIRNEHGNIQYRLNGVTVPQGFSGFGALVDPRIASSIEVITGALPAQYGFRTAGIVNLKTRTDSFDFDGDVGVYGGSNNSIQPSVTLRDGLGSFNYFVSGSYLRNDQGVSNPTPARDAIHDHTEQYRGFAFLSDVLDDSSRISAFGGVSYGTFQIPNVPGVPPQFTLNGKSTFDSARLNQNQRQQSQFGVLTYQHSSDRVDFQIAPFVRYARARFTPDPAGGNLIFNGGDSDLSQSSLAWGAQADAGIKLGDRHNLRAGLFYQRERTKTDSINRVFAVDAAGNQASDVPIVIALGQSQSGTSFGAYLQDEWQPTDTLTVNLGVRYDRSDALVREDQLSPRFGVVWKPARNTTFHAGYARYFTPPPIELAVAQSLGAFDGTTGASSVKLADPIRSEREHNFDVGVQQFVTPQLSVTLDTYYKIKTNLLDEQNLGATLIQSPFNYGKSHSWGVEAGLNFESHTVEFYANIARGDQKAKNIVSNQFFFDPGDLSYIANNYIFTDHSQKWTGSAGGALKLVDGLGKLTPSFDLIYGSGLRKDDPAGIVPNGGTVSPYVQVNVGLSQAIGDEEHSWTLRLDVTNLFDKVYLLRDGSGVGAGQPQYGPRRGYFVGLRKAF